MIEKETFLVEELESRLAIEAAKYQHLLNEDWQNTKFDPMYFDTFISGELYGEFVQAIYDRIKPLNNHEVNRYLTLSVAQFRTHTPDKREQVFFLNYHNSYWFPNVVEFKKEEYEVKYVTHVWKHYKNHFRIFKEATEKALEDFKSGLMGSLPQAQQQLPNNPNQIKNDSLFIFLKALTYNYPYEYSAFNFKYQMKDNLDYLKQEVLENLITIDKEARLPYLNKLKFEIGNNSQYADTTEADIKIWLEKYNVEDESDIGYTKNSDILFRILNKDTPTIDEEFEPNFNRDTHAIQREFFNYYYGLYINKAVAFLEEQLLIHNPNQIQLLAALNSANAETSAVGKLKTDLSVPQLAFLFKMLNDLKPNIFNVKSEAELHRFIKANFETKKSTEEGISTDKLRILFNKPDSKAAQFWEKHFHTLIAEVKKFK